MAQQRFHLLAPTSPVYTSNSINESETFPDPKAVMRKSLIVPGWGQITNKQTWKVPIVYGLLGGLTYYSITLTKDYHDYSSFTIMLPMKIRISDSDPLRPI